MTSADCSPGQGGKRFYVSNTYLVYGHNGDRTPAHQALVIGPHQKPLRNLKDLQALDGKVCKLSFQRKEDGRWSVSIGVALAKQAAQPPMKAPPANDSSVFPPLPASQSQNNVTDRQRGGGAKPDLRTHTSIQAAQGRRPSSVPPKPATPPIPATDSTVLGKVSPSLSRLPPQQSLKSTPASAHTIPASGLHKPGSSSTPSVPASVPLASRGPSPAPSNVMVQRSSTAPTTGEQRSEQACVIMTDHKTLKHLLSINIRRGYGIHSINFAKKTYLASLLRVRSLHLGLGLGEHICPPIC